MGRLYGMVPVSKLIVLTFIIMACGKDHISNNVGEGPYSEPESNLRFSYLALGDSYTVGESVASNKSFPAQLSKQLKKDLSAKIDLEIIATTGWRTDNLLDALKNKPKNPTYDFVTLLIGVNNQYQGRPFEQYEEDFPKLLNHALSYAGGDPSRVAVISIPDYGYTPFGQHRDTLKISSEIDAYNTFAQSTSVAAGVKFIDITDITRRGLDEPNLVANDGLHPSGDAYGIFVSRIAPFISAQLKD